MQIYISGFLTLALMLLSLNQAAFATDQDRSIIEEALNGMVCPRNIDVIVEGAYYQSHRLNGKEKKPERHFESATLDHSFRYIKAERKKVLNAAREAGPDSEMRTRALFHFGMMLHTVNAFYQNTDFLEKETKKLADSGSNSFDPYEMELIDWSEAEKAGYKKLSKEERDKRATKQIQNSTYGKVARGLAIREAARQWDYLEGLLRTRYPQDADTIVAALKSAGCDNLVPEEIKDHALHARTQSSQ